MLKKQNWMHFAPELLLQWRQMMEEGRDVEQYRQLCEKVAALSEKVDCEAVAQEIMKQMEAEPCRRDYPYFEPSDSSVIHKCAERVHSAYCLSVDELRDKISGAWIGRISGCLLGKPMECLKSDVIQTILKESGNYPMNRYVDSRDFSKELPEKVDLDRFQAWQKCWIDRIGGKAPVDDDTNYTVLAMKLIDEYGKDFTPDDVLEAWLYWMPMFSACTAERVAYRNAAQGMLAPETATHANPYREWIGAQIRGDFFGYLNYGNPEKAAEMAWRDASISHTKNGIYGEMFVAAMIAQAAVSSDMEEVVETGIKVIPGSSRLAEEIRRVLMWYQTGAEEAHVFAQIHEKYDEYDQHNWCHVISNAMIVTACLLYGKKDFGKSICMAVQTGFDTDCNAATVGSILGIMLGEKGIPQCWPDGFNRILRTGIEGYHEVTVEQLVEKTMQLIARELVPEAKTSTE